MDSAPQPVLAGAPPTVLPRRLGVVALAGDTRQRLVHALDAVDGVQVGCAVAPERLAAAAGRLPLLDAWVACLPPDGSADGCLDLLWEDAGTPVFVSDRLPACDADLRVFCRQVAAKLDPLAQPGPARPALDLLPAHGPQMPPPVPPVWVLAASLGGPGAVRQFLKALPGAPPVALLYAQHIDAGQESRLARLVCRDTPVHPGVLDGAALAAGSLCVVPVGRQLAVADDGSVSVTDSPWRGPWSPDIGAVVAAVAGVFGAAGGAVFFSGMGDDGAATAAAASRSGFGVWAQTPGTSASPVMPSAAIATGACTGSAPPRELARRLHALWARQAARVDQ